MFQIFTMGEPSIPVGEPTAPASPAAAAAKLEISRQVQNIIESIGSTGNKNFKLGFTPGPLALDHSNQDIRRLIRESFEIAQEKNVAAAFHLDDSMFWGNRKDLTQDISNIEWMDWNKTPNTGRRIDWSQTPSKFAPQMCFNSPAIQKTIRARAHLIGQEITVQANLLKQAGKEELFAGIIAGWETMIGQDFKTGKYLGYCALSNKGFNATHSPKDIDREREVIVQEFMEFWAKELSAAGIKRDKIYGHIAFTPQGLTSTDEKGQNRTYGETVHFSTPDIAFSPFYRPGFSTYPMPGTMPAIYQELEKRNTPPWSASEGTNVVPNGMPGEPTMETYLGRMFNHGAVFVNIFSWGIGGDALKNKNFFRLATENEEALSAYRKFLRGERLSEAPLSSFSPVSFQKKIQKIQRELPPWVQKNHGQSIAQPLIQKLDSAAKAGRFQEADKISDELLDLIQQNQLPSSSPSPARGEGILPAGK